MNKQGKDGIEWCDYTWNPVSGCLHNCPYCYAARAYKRFNKSFEPQFHAEKLGEPAKLKKPSKIFVGSTTDMFGDFIPDEWIEQVFKACEAAPWHTYLFLTKNPLGLRYPFHLNFYYNLQTTIIQNWRIGTSVTRASDLRRLNYLVDETAEKTNRFISIEPLLGDIGYIPELAYFGWVIIGQQTGAGAVKPKPEWVDSIINQCQSARVPVFVKSPLYKQFPIQQWPEGLGVSE